MNKKELKEKKEKMIADAQETAIKSKHALERATAFNSIEELFKKTPGMENKAPVAKILADRYAKKADDLRRKARRKMKNAYALGKN